MGNRDLSHLDWRKKGHAGCGFLKERQGRSFLRPSCVVFQN